MEKEFFEGMNLAEDISDEDFQLIVEGWEKVQDQISKEEFISKFNEHKEEYQDASFFKDLDFMDMVVNPLVGGEDIGGEPAAAVVEGEFLKISDVEPGNEGFNVIARIMTIGNSRVFKSRNGKDGKLCNLQIADDTGELRLVLWTENIKHLRHVREGDIVEITNIECKEGFRGGKEFSLRPRSSLKPIEEGSENYPNNIADFPVYEENIIQINDVKPDETVSIIGRLIRVPAPHSYESNGKKGKVTSLEIQDASGKISYTLWNNDVKLIDTLELKEGDIVKILNEQSRERNGEISLSHWNGRICKAEGDYDIPEYEEKLIKIGEAQEMNDVSLIGIVSKVQDVIEFNRNDGSKGYVKSIELSDDTGHIRVTLWGDDTKKEISKGDIVKVIGGNIEYDDYSNGYRVNTNWNTELKINPNENSELISGLKELAQNLGPIPITQVHEIEDDGEEVDVIGRLISINDIHKFQRDDGSEGCVRSGELADGSSPDGLVRVSFWDDKTKSEFKIGGAYLIENARTRMGMYAMEINVGKTTRFMEIPENEVTNLPSFEELEDSIYITRTLEELDEDDTSIKVLVRILDIQEAREFPRQDGTKGLVGNMEVGDETGSIRVTLWDEKTNIPYSVGDAIKIQNPRVRYNSNYDTLELSVGNGTNILTPSAKESESIPDIKELQNNLYESKEIENLSEEDTNVRITGVFKDIYGQKLLIPKCPHCNNTLEPEDIDNEECSFCGNYIDEPNYLLMLPGRLEDETGEVQVTFFNNLVEELIGMKHDEIVELYEAEGGDLGALEGKVNDLEGLTLEILADVSFNEYDEDIRLRPKKIFNREY